MLIPFDEWLPDSPSYGNEGVGLARNVLPTSDPSPGYGPARQFVPAGAILADDPPTFLAAVRSPSATSYQFAGSPTRLYRSTDSGFTFHDVSRGGGTYATEDTARWSSAMFGESLVLTNYADAPQVFDLGTATKFVNLSATAPKARCVVGAKNFLIFGNVVDEDGAQPSRIRWSGQDRIDYFPAIGSTDAIEVQSDRQDILNDGGPIYALCAPVAGCDFLIVQENALVKATYVGAQSGIFQFDDVLGVNGALSPGAVCRSGSRVHYWSADGYRIWDGSQSLPAGAGKVDRWVFDRLKLDEAWRMQGMVDPRRKIIRWLMPSKLTGKLDLMVIYHETTGWWSYADGYDLACLGTSIATAKLVDDIAWLLDGPTLDGEGNVIAGSDISELRIDDPIWSGENVMNLAAFDVGGRFGSLTGTPLEAELETGERNLSDGQESLVNQLWPLVDGTGQTLAALGVRKTLNEPRRWTDYGNSNRLGFVMRRGRCRYHTARVKKPAGVEWQFAQGVRMPFIPSGRG